MTRFNSETSRHIRAEQGVRVQRASYLLVVLPSKPLPLPFLNAGFYMYPISCLIGKN